MIWFLVGEPVICFVGVIEIKGVLLFSEDQRIQKLQMRIFEFDVVQQ
jgi:hypothetical protein